MAEYFKTYHYLDTMLIVIGIMFFGVSIGLLLRNNPPKFLVKLINVVIYILLLTLGISVGANKMIINNLHTLGIQALIITLGALAGSIFLSWLLFRYLFNK